MQLFDFLKNLTIGKEDYQLAVGDDFSPYLIQRWLSMTTPLTCAILNESTNRFKGDDQMFHDMLLMVVPKKYCKFTYFKKDKAEKDPDVEALARRMEVSQREAKMMLEFDDTIHKEKKTTVFQKL